jgi:hypothetical protein
LDFTAVSFQYQAYPFQQYNVLYNELLHIENSAERKRTLDNSMRLARDWTIANREGHPQRTWVDLSRDEKACFGVAVQRECSRNLGWRTGVFAEYSDANTTNVPDAVITGIEVEIKSSSQGWFGIRSKQVGHWALLFDSDNVIGDYRLGLLFVELEHLTDSKNDASKKSLTASALKAVDWVVTSNFLSEPSEFPRWRLKEIAAEKRERNKAAKAEREAAALVLSVAA